MDALCDRPCAIGGVTNVKSRHGLVSAEITFPRLVAQRENISKICHRQNPALRKIIAQICVAGFDREKKHKIQCTKRKVYEEVFFLLTAQDDSKDVSKFKLVQVQLVVLLAKQGCNF